MDHSELPANLDLMSGFFYNLGRKMGHAAIPAIRKSKWIWNGLTGTDEESLRAEESLGSTLAAELRAATVPGNDAEASGRVAELTRRLEACIRPPRTAYSCEVMHDASPNAMALPGGYLFVSDSLIQLTRSPDELAFVIGHEMAHVIQRDAWNRMLNQAMLKAASAVAMRSGYLGTWLRQNGLALLRSAHERDREFAADALGFNLMVAAGFQPDGAFTILDRIATLGNEPTALGQYFSSHPPAHERYARLGQLKVQASDDSQSGR